MITNLRTSQARVLKLEKLTLNLHLKMRSIKYNFKK